MNIALLKPFRKHYENIVAQNYDMHIGQRIKQLMKDKGVTTRSMSEHCDVSAGAVSNWFSSGRISKDNLVKAADKLGVNVVELISGEQSAQVDVQGYSTEALALAWLLDQIPNRLDKTIAANAATAAVLEVLQRSGAKSTHTPGSSAIPTKLNA